MSIIKLLENNKNSIYQLLFSILRVFVAIAAIKIVIHFDSSNYDEFSIEMASWAVASAVIFTLNSYSTKINLKNCININSILIQLFVIFFIAYVNSYLNISYITSTFSYIIFSVSSTLFIRLNYNRYIFLHTINYILTILFLPFVIFYSDYSWILSVLIASFFSILITFYFVWKEGIKIRASFNFNSASFKLILINISSSIMIPIGFLVLRESIIDNGLDLLYFDIVLKFIVIPNFIIGNIFKEVWFPKKEGLMEEIVNRKQIVFSLLVFIILFGATIFTFNKLNFLISEENFIIGLYLAVILCILELLKLLNMIFVLNDYNKDKFYLSFFVELFIFFSLFFTAEFIVKYNSYEYIYIFMSLPYILILIIRFIIYAFSNKY